MKEYLEQVKNRMHSLNAKFVQIPREENERADRLAKAASAEHMSFPCQRFGNLIRQPVEVLTPMKAPWPFPQWGLDIMGPFPTAVRQLKFLLGGIDYFTKWVEAEALATITKKNLGIKNHYSSPLHYQANGQIEVTNQSLLKIIKTRLEGAKGIWLEELPSVLWAYMTTARTPTEETPFRLVYGSEAVIPTKVGLTSYRVANHDEEKNDEAMRLQLHMVDEVRALAEQRLARYQNLMVRHYNSWVKHRDF
ncbi:uncharacterized protein LOC142640253 [Castanea sativa]|uniref:uncharacterized protein LOC142640253 n=1 Tax=Castanea sativa TaxID=21020 RepID=UPI003F64CD00